MRKPNLCIIVHPVRKVRDLAHVIGLIVSSFPAIRPAKLYYRGLEALKLQALSLNDGDYEANLLLTESAKEDLFGL